MKSGGRGRLSTLAAGVFLLLMVVFIGDWVAHIPMAALVAVMIMVSIGTFNWASIRNLRQHPKSSSVVMLATVVVTVGTHDLAKGVLVGVLLSGFFFAHKVGQILRLTSRTDDEGRLRTYVLVCVDQSRFADYVADYAAWAACRLDAPLEFLHVIDRHPEQGSSEDHSGIIGIDAQEHLLSKLSAEDAARTKNAREQGRIFLNRLRERARAAGAAQVDVRQRHGVLEEALAEQEKDLRLLVLGRRGEAADTTRRALGRHVEQVVRALHKPILTVTDDFREPQRVMIAFDGGIVTRRGVQMIADSPLFRGLPIYLLSAGKNSRDAPKQLDWARSTLEAAGFAVTAALLPGDAESIIARTVRAQDIDLLIMGAFSHSPLRSLLFGNKTTDLLRSAAIPTLLLR